MFFQCLNVEQNKENEVLQVEQQQYMNDKIKNYAFFSCCVCDIVQNIKFHNENKL